MQLIRPQSFASRVTLAALALWFAGAVGFVLSNRYGYWSDFDSIVDIVLLGVVVPLAVACVVYAHWVLGRTGARYLAGLFVLLLALFAVLHVYDYYEESRRISERALERAERRASIERRFGAKCAAEAAKSPTIQGGAAPGDYEYCLVLSEMEHARRPRD